MTGRRTAGRRQRFSPRQHEVLSKARAPEVHSISYRVAGADADEAVAAAKVQARGEGWHIRTLSSARPATDLGMWLVTFAAAQG